MISKHTKHAKSLRKRPTNVEAILWNRLRARQIEGVKFRGQQPIENFIFDFISFEKRIVVQLDGGQHAENRDKDIQRDRFFAENGFEVLRFWNNDVLENLEGVLEVIRKKCIE